MVKGSIGDRILECIGYPESWTEQEIEDKVISIIRKCTGKSDEDTYKNLCSYFRIQKSL